MHPLSPALESEHVTAVACGQTHTVVAAGGECHIHAEVEVEEQPLHGFYSHLHLAHCNQSRDYSIGRGGVSRTVYTLSEFT